jgi:hypothetical protein
MQTGEETAPPRAKRQLSKRLLVYGLLAIVFLYLLLTVVTSIRTLMGSAAREQELKDLLGDAKKEFLAASATFGLLDTTYNTLDKEYDTVYANANDISLQLTAVDEIANDITNEFGTVASTFLAIETAYSGVIDQYNSLSTIAGLAYLRTGSEEDGRPVQIQYYPYGGNKNTMLAVNPILVPSDTELVYTNENDFVDSRKTLDANEVQDPAVTPVLRALDLDGRIQTRDSPGGKKLKEFQVWACYLDNTYQFVSIDVTLEGRTEKFVVDEALHNRVKEELYHMEGVRVPSIDADSMYAFECNQAGALFLRKLTPEQKGEIENNEGPAYKPATITDLTQLQGQVFDKITPSIDKVMQLNLRKNVAMAEAVRAREAIATSQQARLELSRTHQKLVDQFETFSVEKLVPPRDLLDSFCTVM